MITRLSRRAGELVIAADAVFGDRLDEVGKAKGTVLAGRDAFGDYASSSPKAARAKLFRMFHMWNILRTLPARAGEASNHFAKRLPRRHAAPPRGEAQRHRQRHGAVNPARRFLLIEFAIPRSVGNRFRVERAPGQNRLPSMPQLGVDNQSLKRVNSRRHILKTLAKRDQFNSADKNQRRASPWGHGGINP